MKKVPYVLLLFFLLAALAAGCGKAPQEPTPTPAETFSEMDELAATSLARAFFHSFTAGDYEIAYSYPLDYVMRNAFIPSVMQMASEEIQEKYGAFVETQGEQTGYADGFFVFTIGGVHEKKTLAYSVVVSPQIQVAGFHYSEMEDPDAALPPANADGPPVP